MADQDISIASVNVLLESGVGMSSAVLMKDAYLPTPLETSGERRPVAPVQSDDLYPAVAQAGPDARIYLTKIISRTPDDVVDRVLMEVPDHTTLPGNYHFFTMIVALSIRPGDPTTTRLINGMIEFAFLDDEEIIRYSPKDKGSITALINHSGTTISLSQDLEFFTPKAQNTATPPDTAEQRLSIPVGPGEELIGTYMTKTGYSFAIPVGIMLEYQGMLKNRHEMLCEIYPPMPPQDQEIRGDAMLAMFSFIIRTPNNSPPKIRAVMECRVKGNLWGVIPLKGSVEIT